MSTESKQRTPVDWVVQRPLLALIVSFLLIVVLATGVTRLSFSNDIRVFFDEDNADLQAYEEVEQVFSKSTNVLIVVSPKDPQASIFDRDALKGLLYLTDEAWKTPYARRVDSLTNYQYSYAEGMDIVVEDLISPYLEEMTDEAIAQRKAVALEDPLLVNHLVSPDGRVGGINIPISLPGENELAEQPEVAGYVRDLAAEAEARFPHLDVRLTGIIMINQELAEAAERDFATLIPLMFLFIFAALAILLRSLLASMAAFGVIVLANVAAFGTAGYLGITLSPPVISAVNMIMTLAIADSVHILAHFRNAYHPGVSKIEALGDSLRSNFRPILLTSVTTVIGFLSLNTSDSPPFRDLGNIVAIGIVFAWLFAHTLLPPLILFLPLKPRQWGGDQSGSGRFLTQLSQRVGASPRRYLFSGLVLTLICVALIPRNELNDEFVKYFDEDSSFRQDTDFTINQLTGFEYIKYAIDSGEPGGIADPEYLEKLDAFAAWFRQQPAVRHVYAHSDLIKRLHKNLHEDDPAEYRIPETRPIASDCLTLYEMSLPFGLDLTDRINLDKSATLFRVSLSNITSNEMIALDQAARDWLREHELSPGASGTGQSMMFARIGIRNIQSLLSGTVLALVLISACMIVITRSFKFGLISLLPNLAPAAIGFGLWGLFVGQVGLAISVVVGMTLGIVVDDSIHYILKYLKHRREDGDSPEAANRKTMQHVGRAMFTTTIALVGGFGILAFSGFELNKGMGILSAVVIAFALLFDLIVLPALLQVIDRDKSKP